MNIKYPVLFGKTSNQVRLDDFLTGLNIPKWELKKYDIRMGTEEIVKDIQNQAIDNLVIALREVEPDVPDEILRAFVITFMGYEINVDHDLRTNSSQITCKPCWKDSSMIDWNSEEAKLLDEYIWSDGND